MSSRWRIMRRREPGMRARAFGLDDGNVDQIVATVCVPASGRVDHPVRRVYV